ncbi:MAG: sulfite exporter TauE/SafE family protein, partial [Betaproteobacteria bacterium]|nr:sulfite exporter TauE/SafE family protein [Betaproteobacteria bacterium]
MRVRDLDLSDTPINAEHQRLGIPPVERQIQQGTVVISGIPVVGFAMWLSAAMLVVLSGYMLTQLFSNGASSAEGLLLGALRSEVFWSAVLVGLIAQVIDGALGMAYGITSTTFLMAIGVSPAMASASVHVAEVFTTGVSGIAHAKLGNVNKSLFLRLLIPGIIGAVIGAYLVVNI